MVSSWTPDLPLFQTWRSTRRGRVKMGIRPSQRKFESSSARNVEICAWSAFRRAFLNRQVILLLSELGVAEEVFRDRQERFLRVAERALFDRPLALALLELWSGDGDVVGARSGTAAGAALEMLKAGFSLETEPFIRLVIPALQESILQDLRYRARIPLEAATPKASVPESRGEGALMLGVADETGTLKSGEVFIQSNGHVIEGPVVVAKNPCVHPGDIRVLTAVRGHFILRESARDCLVFPTVGDRPHQDECSGSDLDGDTYLVLWDQAFLPPKGNQIPLDHAKAPAERQDVSEERLIDHFLAYMLNTDLGQIANAHLALSDQRDEGVFDKDCLELARYLNTVRDLLRNFTDGIDDNAGDGDDQ
jgi:RNA-dependent RNA polymerase